MPASPVLASLDMSQQLERDAYKRQLDRERGRLNRLFRRTRQRGLSVVLAFEGWDAAGKGGAIRRLTGALDGRDYRVVPIAAPTDEERRHHYLWRFWRHLPAAGRMVIFDRSWYGRVLVERVEGHASEPEWRRAYGEINEFERQLIDHGAVLAKFLMHITPDEQAARFRERQQVLHKRWKLTHEDWRNRSRWAQYEAAAQDMIDETSTPLAPWTLVEANDKRFARIKVLKTFCACYEAALKRK